MFRLIVFFDVVLVLTDKVFLHQNPILEKKSKSIRKKKNKKKSQYWEIHITFGDVSETA